MNAKAYYRKDTVKKAMDWRGGVICCVSTNRLICKLEELRKNHSIYLSKLVIDTSYRVHING